jgi:hypothetical protein
MHDHVCCARIAVLVAGRRYQKDEGKMINEYIVRGTVLCNEQGIGKSSATGRKVSCHAGKSLGTLGKVSNVIGKSLGTPGKVSNIVGKSPGTPGKVSNVIGKSFGAPGKVSNIIGKSSGVPGKVSPCAESLRGKEFPKTNVWRMMNGIFVHGYTARGTVLCIVCGKVGERGEASGRRAVHRIASFLAMTGRSAITAKSNAQNYPAQSINAHGAPGRLHRTGQIYNVND